ncbi:hypothetical protein OEZ86_013847 [Tetradesmus obliquus]|nr:hypothetical protein OEZ86_013847 [Tetradesmus obliquus]
MSNRRRGFAAINARESKNEKAEETEKIEALESRLVQQHNTAVQLITAGQRDAAKTILQQLLQEPLLQEQAVAAAAAAAAGSSAGKPAAATAAAAAAAAAPQSRALQGMRYKVLLNLAPLLGSTPEALQAWCDALSHNPTNPKAWEEASLVLAQQGQLHLAVYAAGVGLRLAPDSVLLLERLVVMLAAQHDWRGAAGVLSELRRASGGWHPW